MNPTEKSQEETPRRVPRFLDKIPEEFRSVHNVISEEERLAWYMKHGLTEAEARRALHARPCGMKGLTTEEADAEAVKGGFTGYVKAVRQYEKDKLESPETAKVIPWEWYF